MILMGMASAAKLLLLWVLAVRCVTRGVSFIYHHTRTDLLSCIWAIFILIMAFHHTYRVGSDYHNDPKFSDR